jgi:hypothetical protein
VPYARGCVWRVRVACPHTYTPPPSPTPDSSQAHQGAEQLAEPQPPPVTQVCAPGGCRAVLGGAVVSCGVRRAPLFCVLLCAPLLSLCRVVVSCVLAPLPPCTTHGLCVVICCGCPHTVHLHSCGTPCVRVLSFLCCVFGPCVVLWCPVCLRCAPTRVLCCAPRVLCCAPCVLFPTCAVLS